MTWTDLYQNQSNTAAGVGRADGPVGPNQSYVMSASTPFSAASEAASGSAFSWLGLVLALVLLRVLISMGGRVA